MNKKNSIIFLIALVTVISVAGAIMIWQEKESLRDNAFLDNLKNENEKPKSSAVASSADTSDKATAANNPGSNVSGQTNQSLNALSNQSLADENASQNQEVKPESQETEPEKETDQVYKSAEDNYEFKYSKDVSISQSGDYLVVSKENKPWKIKVYNNKNKKELQDWFDGNFSEKERQNCTFSGSDVRIGNYETKYVNPNPGDTACAEDGYYALNSDKTKVVRVKVGKETVENVNKILETFKFL